VLTNVRNRILQYSTHSAGAKEYEQICHFKRLENVNILQLTCFIELDLLRRQSLLGLVLSGFFFLLNHSGNTRAIFLIESYEDYALVQLHQLKIFTVLNRTESKASCTVTGTASLSLVACINTYC